MWEEERFIRKNEKYMDEFRGCLIGGAIGDALGYPIEFMKYEEIQNRYGSDGIKDYQLLQGKALISDDTQMTLFTATGLLSGKTRVMMSGNAESLVPYAGLSYKTWHQMQIGNNPRDGDGNAYSWLADVPEMGESRAPGITCMSVIATGRFGTLNNPVNKSKGCGGIMRVAPIGLYLNRLTLRKDEIDEVDRVAAEVAALTHGHELGWLSSAALAHIINRLVYSNLDLPAVIWDMVDELKKLYRNCSHLPELIDLIEKAMILARNDEPDIVNIRQLGEGWVAEETLAIAIYCSVKYQDEFSHAICAAVNHDGDSDSTGAVTGNILGAMTGYEMIPDKWKDSLECKDVILEVADDLCRDCHISKYSIYDDVFWKRKYIENKRWSYMDFYGSEDSYAVYLLKRHRKYPGIVTPVDLYKVLSGVWCAQTCAPRMRDKWTVENKTMGQCSITAFLAQDIFGGTVRGMTTENGNIHCYNVVNGIVFDLTSEQFGKDAKKLVYDGSDPIQERESAYHFGKQEKRERYEYLKNALEKTVLGI